jgi:hypothetical protein
MPANKTTIADLFKESVIFQGLLAILCVVGTFALLLLGRPVPVEVWLINGSALGFFFGARNLLTARNSAQEANRVTEMVVTQNAQIISTLAQLGIGGAVGVRMRVPAEKAE